MNKEMLRRELKTLIEANAVMVRETQRIWGAKKEITEFERGRAEGIILCGADNHDNLLRFAERIGIKFGGKA